MRCTIFLLTLFLSFNAMANDCDDIFEAFRNGVSRYTEKKRFDYESLKATSELYTEFLNQAEALTCDPSIIESAKETRDDVRKKRLETIQKQLNFGITREAEIDLAFEVGVLTNDKINYVYPFSDFVGAYKLGKTDIVVEIPAQKKPNNPVGPNTQKPPESLPNPLPKNQEEGPKKSQVIPPASKKLEEVVPDEPHKSCSKVMLENDAVNMNNTRNQDTFGWCYAYTAADLLSFHYNQRISAISLYARPSSNPNDLRRDKIFNQINDEKLQGGDPRVVVNNFKKDFGGFCLESDLHSTDYHFCQFKDIATLLNFIQNDHTPVEEWNQCMKKDIKEVFPSFTAESFGTTLAKVGYQSIVETLINQSCRDIKFKDKPAELTSDLMSPSSDLMEKIKWKLNAGSPVGINYDILNLQGKEKGLRHGSIIMGRQFNLTTQKCEYLIRNSWGRDCSINENEKIRCHQKCEGPKNCRETGYLWVGEKDLEENLGGIFYVK